MKPLICLIDSSSHTLYRVSSIHCRSVKLGVLSDVYTANKILSSYSRCGALICARKLFEEIPHRDSVSWNTMISGCVSSGSLASAWEFLKSMRRCDVDVDGYTFGGILKGVSCHLRLDMGEQIHSLVIKTGMERNVYAGSALLDMYAKCDRVEDAVGVFQELPEPNTVSWNALISGFVQVGDREPTFWLLRCMEMEGLKIDDGTMAPILSLLDNDEFYVLATQVHGKVLKLALDYGNTVCNALITAYAECGSIKDARRVFDESEAYRDLVAWNSMLAAYVIHKQDVLAFELFLVMQATDIKPDIYAYTSMISACFEKENKDIGKSFHGLVIKRGLEQSASVSNALVSMYLQSDRSVEDALQIFGSLESRDRVSWNSILTGFSQLGFSEEAVKFFGHLRSLLEGIDHYALSAVLRSCSDLATLRLGCQVHSLAIKSGFESNNFVASSLILVYSKCGVIEDAWKAFEDTPKDSSITWNSIIFGYAQHGSGDVALELFSKMRQENVKLDNITFVAVLTACSHIGLVEQGLEFLNSMETVFGITPCMEHYACAVDLLGRATRLSEAEELIKSMPFEPDGMVLRTFLGACRACGNIELASHVASRLLEIEPQEHSTYVLLSNIYGHLHRWREKASVARLMRERGVRKVPGWSWIEVKNEVHAFHAEDRSNPHGEEIYLRLDELTEEIRGLDLDAGFDSLAMHSDLMC